MITCHKNLNAYHRVEGIPAQFGVQGALQQQRVQLKWNP